MDVDTLKTEDQKAQKMQNRKRLRDHLVDVYKKTCSKMPVAPPKRNMLADIKDHYREQDMKQVKMPHEPKSNQGDMGNIRGIREQKADQKVQELTSVNSYHDIFHRKGKKCQNIYIKGEAGSGKTVFCQNMVNRWCRTISSGVKDTAQTDDQARSSYHDIDSSEFQSRLSCEEDNQSEVLSRPSCEDEFEFLFYIQLRYATEHRDIIQMIKEILLMDYDDQASVLTDILNNEPEKCLVLLDGLDEWAPPKGSTPAPHVTRGLPGRNIMTNWTVLTTTRPSKLELVRPESEEMDQLIELLGLTQYSATECIESVVQYLNDRFKKNKDAFKCYSDLNTDDLKHFMTLPILLNQLVCVWFDKGQVGSSLCDIYAGIIDLYLRYAEQRGETSDSVTHSPSDTLDYSLPPCFNNRHSCKEYTRQLYSLSSLAFHTLFCEDRESSLVFNSAKTAETDMWLNVGLLSQDIADIESATEHKQLSFPHKSIQEFLAAVYISVCYNDNIAKQISDICKSVDMVMEMSQVFLFVAGMNPSTFTKISEHIAEVVNHDGKVEQYRTSFRQDSSRILVVQNLVLKCIEESKANHHSDIAIYSQDILLGKCSSESSDLSKCIKMQVDLISMNKANVVSLTVFGDGHDGGIFATYIFECEDAFDQRFAKLKTLHAINADISMIKSILEINQNTLETVSLDYETKYDLTKTEIDVFTRFSHLHAISLANIKLSYHQIRQILSVTQNAELQETVVSQLIGSSSTGRHINYDKSQNTRLQHLKLNDLQITKVDTGLSRHATRACNKQLHEGETIRVNTTQLESCIITEIKCDDAECLQCFPTWPIEFICTAQRLALLILSNIVLTHDQLHGLMSFVTRASRLREITLSQLRCVDHGNTCEYQLELTTHTVLQQLKLYSVCMKSLKVTTKSDGDTNPDEQESARVNLYSIDTNDLLGQERCRVNLYNIHTNVLHISTDRLALYRIRVDELQVDTTQLVACTIADVSSNGTEPLHHHCALLTLGIEARLCISLPCLIDIDLIHESEPSQHGSALSSFEFIGTAQHLTLLNLSNIALKHDHLQGLMSFVTRTTCLEEIALSQLKCVDPGNTCECQLDLAEHTFLRKLKVDSIHVTSLKVTTNTHGDTNPGGKESDRVILNNIHTTVLQIDTDRLTVDMLHVNDLHVNTTRLVACTIADVSSSDTDPLLHDAAKLEVLTNASLGISLPDIIGVLDRTHHSQPRQHGSALSSFEFIGTAQHLKLLNLSKIVLTHDQLQGVMSFVTRTTRLEKITLYQLRCVDHGDSCEYQLDLTEHTSRWLKLDRLHVNVLKVNTTQLEKCTIIGVSSNDSESSQHDSALSTFEFIGTAQHLKLLNLSKIVLTHDQLQGVMSFVTRTTRLEKITLYQLRCVDHGDSCEYQLELTEHTSRWLKLDRLHVNVLKVNTTQLEKCTIIGVSSNDSESSQHDSALFTFEFIGTAQNLTLLNLSKRALKHDQFQELVSFVTLATRLEEITLSELRCLDHGNVCTCQLYLTEHKSIRNLKLHSIHVNVLNVCTSLDLFYRFPSSMERVDCVELHANAVQINTQRLDLNRLHVNELEVNSARLKYCTITDVRLNDSEPGQKDCALYTFEFIGTAQVLQYLELRNINLRHDHFEKILPFVTQTTCLQKIILSELICVDNTDHGNSCECQLNLMNHKQLQKLEIENLHVNEVQVNAPQLKCCSLTNLGSTAINLIPGDSPTSVDLTVYKGERCENLVVGNVHLTHEQLDRLVASITHTKGRCVVSLYEIECSECDEECSRIVNLQQLVRFRQPDDEDATAIVVGNSGGDAADGDNSGAARGDSDGGGGGGGGGDDSGSGSEGGGGGDSGGGCGGGGDDSGSGSEGGGGGDSGGGRGGGGDDSGSGSEGGGGGDSGGGCGEGDGGGGDSGIVDGGKDSDLDMA